MSKDDVVTELCCGTTCNVAVRDAQLKLLGAREYHRLIKSTIRLTKELSHYLDEIETEYNVSLKK